MSFIRYFLIAICAVILLVIIYFFGAIIAKFILTVALIGIAVVMGIAIYKLMSVESNKGGPSHPVKVKEEDEEDHKFIPEFISTVPQKLETEKPIVIEIDGTLTDETPQNLVTSGSTDPVSPTSNLDSNNDSENFISKDRSIIDRKILNDKGGETC